MKCEHMVTTKYFGKYYVQVCSLCGKVLHIGEMNITIMNCKHHSFESHDKEKYVVVICSDCGAILAVRERVKKTKYFFVSVSNALAYIMKNGIRMDEIEGVLCRYTNIDDVSETIKDYYWTGTAKEYLYRALYNHGKLIASRTSRESGVTAQIHQIDVYVDDYVDDPNDL